MEKIDEILENMEFLDNWEDKYKYIIELGQYVETQCRDIRGSTHARWTSRTVLQPTLAA